MFRSYVSSKLLYFVGKVFDENTGKAALGQMVGNNLGGCLFEQINYLVQFFTGRCQSYSFIVKFTLRCVHKF